MEKKKYTSWKEFHKAAEKSISYKVESILVEFVADVCSAMERTKTSRVDLAKKMKCSPANITRIMKCPDNITLETMVKIADALDLVINVEANDRSSAVGPRVINPFRPSSWGSDLRSISQETRSEVRIAA